MTTMDCCTLPPRPARRGLLAALADALHLRRSRARLADLPDHLLRDIGCTRAEAQAEAGRPLWDVPGHWRKG